MKKLLFVSSLLATIVGWSDPITYTFTGNTGWVGNYGHNINGATDAKGAAMWSSGAAADPNSIYQFGKPWTVFTMGDASKFNGRGLVIANNGYFELLMGKGSDSYPTACTIDYLTVDLGSKFQLEEQQWKWKTDDRTLNGTLWTVNGDLEIRPQVNYIRFCLNMQLAGSGTVTLNDSGCKIDANKPKFANQALLSDNSAFSGKFVIDLAKASPGEADARGIEIAQASALGGAPNAFIPDALMLKSWNGLVATETLALDTANRGIDLKANAFFDVVDGKTLTIKEPIRSEGGFFKRGAGTLVLDSAVTFGADGTAEPDGANSRLAVRAGALRCESSIATKDLDVVFSAGAVLELPVDACPDGFPCRSLSTADILDVAVDFANAAVEPGSMQKVVLFTLPEENASAIVGRLNVVAKGGLPIPGAISTESAGGKVAVSATLKVPQEMASVTFTGATGDADWQGHDLNAEKDRGGAYMWSDHLAAHQDCNYLYDRGKDVWTLFKTDSTGKFNGGAIEVASGFCEIKLAGFSEAGRINTFSLDGLLVAAGAKFQLDSTDYTWWSEIRNVEGLGWRVDGNLVIAPLKDWTRFSLNVPLSGSGLVTFGGYKDGDWSAKAPANQVITSDNSQFRGKFTVGLARTGEGGIYARGIEIASASALGGALAVPTPDALTLYGWNGLVATETLSLGTENRGITLKDNAFFEVASGKTLTVAEPIVAEGGFFKCGAGTLAIGASAVVCAEATPFRVAAGAVRPTGKLGLSKLKTTFAEGTALEIDAFEADPAVAVEGFYQPFGWTVESGKLNINVVFPAGYGLEKERRIVLATVPQVSVSALAGNMKINHLGLADRRANKISIEPAGDDLAKIVLTVYHSGSVLIIK